MAASLRATTRKVGDLAFLEDDPEDEPVYHQFTLRSGRRDELQEFLAESGIGSVIHYPQAQHRIEPLARDDIHLGLTRVRSSMLKILDDTGVINAVGADRIFTSNGAAVAAFASRTARAPDPDVVAAEATAALSELADLLDDDDVSQRLRRAIDALDADTDQTP